ncbi:MAG: ABC transporter ATP-binding protein [Nakamurella sp.]
MNNTSPALEAIDLGKRYRRGWALQGCSFSLPAGSVVALVGPNGAGKSTLMALAAGILAPTTGSIAVLGEAAHRRGPHPKLAFLSQDQPLYRRFTVEEMLHFGRSMNGYWDDLYARRLIQDCGIPFNARISTLSGGQHTRVALALALGRRPAALLLDEPLASLDPLARLEVMQTLLAEVVDTGITLLLSSHVIADVEDSCDHLLLLADGHLRLAGPIAELLSAHQLLTGPAGGRTAGPATEEIIDTRSTARQMTCLIRSTEFQAQSDWSTVEPTLQELVLGYLRAAGQAQAEMEPVA